MGVSYPKADDMFDNYDYIFSAGDMKFNLSQHSDRLKAAALCRIIGYIITDGSLNKVLCMGHKIDAQNVLEDITFLTNKTPKIRKCNSILAISVPVELTKAISAILPVSKGRKVYQKMQLPDFLFDQECPTFLIRELLGGMFGGDGVLPSMVKNSCTMMQLVASKEEEYVESLVEGFRKMGEVLLKRFGIESIVSEPKYYENYYTDHSGKDKYNVFLRICKDDSILQFTEKIGVRYCCHKSYRLTAIGSMIRYKQTVRNQNQAIINRTRELVDKYKRQNIPPLIIQLDKNTRETINIFKSTQEAQHSTNSHHSAIKGSIKRNGTCGGYKWILQEQKSEILDEVGCETIKEALEKAKTEVKENIGLSDENNIITYSKIRSYYLVYKNDIQMIPVNIEEYLNSTGLVNFCNQENMRKTSTRDEKHHYSVEKDRESLPCYEMGVIHIENVGKKHVYDLNVEEPYSNFIAEGIVTHNCNKLPKLRYSDKAVWNRIRVIPFESTFCRSDDPAPDSYEEQLLQKRFPMDKDFGSKIPGMVQAFAWILLRHRLNLKDRVEPEKVRMATAVYRKQNDIYRQFIEECITDENNAVITLLELYAQFRDWFKDSLPGQVLPIKNEVEEYFTRLWDEPERGKKWTGYRIKTLQDDINNGDAIVMDESDLVNYDYENGGRSLPPL